MVQRFLPIRLLPILTAPALAATVLVPLAPAQALYEGLQCVPYARQLSGVQIYGDAHTWWGKAQGRYARGNAPKIGAVLAFKPYGKMELGHVAAVSQIVDNRTLLISHANWSTINGVRGHIENNVQVIDVSERNDWSRVRVWYTPIGALGTTEWPTHGFIYPDKAPKSMPPAGSPIQYASKSSAKAAPKPVTEIKGKAPEPARLAARVAPTPNVSTPTYAPAPQRPAPVVAQAPLRDYNARPQVQYAVQPHIQSPAPKPSYQASYHPAPAQRTQKPLPRGYTPSVPAPGTPARGPQNMDDLLKGL